MIADLQSREHGTAWNFEGLHDKGANENGKQQGYADCLDVFPEGRTLLAGRWSTSVWHVNQGEGKT